MNGGPVARRSSIILAMNQTTFEFICSRCRLGTVALACVSITIVIVCIELLDRRAMVIRSEETTRWQNRPFANGISKLVRASYYSDKFQGRKTANGERFDQRKLTAAHRTLPLGSRVRVENIKTGKVIEVRVNDRGPYVKNRELDLSKRAANELGMKRGVETFRITFEQKSSPKKAGGLRRSI